MMMNLKNLYFLVILCGWSLGLGAQGTTYTGDPDVSYYNARNLAFNDQRTQARDTLQRILSKYPEYADVRELLGKTYSWDGRYDEARRHFNKITSVERKNKAVWIAAIKNEIYAKNYPIALGLANKALIYIENDTDILNLRTKVMDLLGAKKDSANEEGTAPPKDSLEAKVLKNRVGVINSFEIFDVVYEPMFYSSVEYRRETDAGSIIPRINYANRFETHGIQYEMDFYPKISKRFYGYLNYGFSQADIFPDHRAGAELYANLPKNLEASLGMRYLDFSTSNATVLTGSIGHYMGNYYFSLRPYVTPRSDGPTSFSGSLLVRKYLRDGENYLGLNAIYGNAPELKQLLVNDVLLSESLLYIESQRLELEYQFTAKDRPNLYRANLGLTRQELVFEPGKFFWAISAGINYQVKF
ncbi:YaiO family outer membrane beta-barrel protein [Spongiimicrobium sp. 2-473A-2-J]|uniref:YaiO family outer membrane beta-barrel protein n=1 Tax=Eudoraea algarum TaxID=3417568 RepID=UPI003D35D7BD